MLKQLILHGFKSFPEKTVLEFPKGITAIVGPNGSGKSNIVDAIRWVLGEQSLKNIRLGKLEDVIFAGTQSKSASGFAEVSLLFDNSKRIFQSELEEIMVARKLYRDGQSLFFLNQQEVRLKDIVRFMASGKLGTKGITIITQGAADVFLSASGEERREMLEEVLGLKEYRLKKEEAERKMEETTLNLSKVSALLDEIAPHLRSLKRQVVRWEKRSQKIEELNQLYEKYFHWKLHSLEENVWVEKEKNSLENEIKDLSEKIQEIEARRQILDQELSDILKYGKFRRKNVDDLIKAREQALRNLGHIEGKLEGLKEKKDFGPDSERLVDLIKEIRLKISHILEEKPDWENIKLILSQIIEEIDRIFSSQYSNFDKSNTLQELESQRNIIISQIENFDRQIDTLRKETEEFWSLQNEKYKILQQILQELEAKREELSKKQETLREYILEGEKIKLGREDLYSKIKEAGISLEEFLNKYKDLPPPDIGAEIEQIESKILRYKKELADIGIVDEEIIKEYEETQNRFSFLSKEKEDLEKAIQDLKLIQKELENKIDKEFKHALSNISKLFNHYFRILFGGGGAKLVWKQIKPKNQEAQNEDTSVPDESIQEESKEGIIDIEVDIPRKKIKSLDMLSGGERALVSIALIFAVVGVSNPPFLVLDEIDASLDEANSARFAHLLKELAKNTQFMLITHNRTTMECADILYGVTMQDGVSKIFSLKFDQAKELASQDIHNRAGEQK